jgi:hypothetical protein
MIEAIVIFCLSTTGCLVSLSTDLGLRVFARKLANGSTASGSGPGQSPESRPKADPIVTFGLTLACYGAIALVLVAELAGELAMERTCLAFALLCAGGLIGEIAHSRTDHQAHEPSTRTPGSLGLSIALMLTLNVAVAVLCGGQGLIQIVPPPAPVSAAESAELEQIVVVARRGSDHLRGPSSFL